MQSKVREYEVARAKQQKIKADLEEMKNSDDYAKVIAFREEISKLMKDYEMGPVDVILSVDPTGIYQEHINVEQRESGLPSMYSSPKKTVYKIYRNPHTNEEVKAARTSHLTIKSWIEKYGKEEVESWVVSSFRS